MSIELHPYLNFDGRTAEAMTFYADVLGGTVRIMRFGDSPMPVDPAHKDRVLHATVTAGAVTLMASDTMPGQPLRQGTNVHLSLNFSTPAEQDRVWARLAEGGHVVMPLAEQFFGRFGVVVDRFGTSWMLHYAAQQPSR